MSNTREITITWNFQDIQTVAEEKEIELTNDEIGDILDKLKARHDCCYGITWKTIDYMVGDLIEERKIGLYSYCVKCECLESVQDMVIVSEDDGMTFYRCIDCN